MTLLGTKKDFSQLFLIFSFEPSESKTVKQLIPMENQNLQQSLLEAQAKTLNITTIHLVNNRHMINGLVNALKSINTTVFHNKIEIQRLNYAQKLLSDLCRH